MIQRGIRIPTFANNNNNNSSNNNNNNNNNNSSNNNNSNFITTIANHHYRRSLVCLLLDQLLQSPHGRSLLPRGKDRWAVILIILIGLRLALCWRCLLFVFMGYMGAVWPYEGRGEDEEQEGTNILSLFSLSFSLFLSFFLSFFSFPLFSPFPFPLSFPPFRSSSQSDSFFFFFFPLFFSSPSPSPSPSRPPLNPIESNPTAGRGSLLTSHSHADKPPLCLFVLFLYSQHRLLRCTLSTQLCSTHVFIPPANCFPL
ncbi:hypothetical protein BC939DRAFT_225618 [Gamsiella multidivaricata]|uniref:uncharacterized protein n=1 Tax=Gamsiella multidivaricata TaxID=101098 RepID=UPI0022206986|nr:uncharacterized protein BC939DRAFT_225618 [Gamsiella multidivaricata]KAI7831303.1 hypothetical protein BC939DRAFT_225618 [Gamsiella multidivaricata]